MHSCEERIIMETETIKKLPKLLKEMRLPIMAEEYENQKSDPAVLQLSFDERLYELVSKEYDSRINHTIERYIKTAGFYDSSANLEDINYKPERKLDKGLIDELSTNDYLEHGLNIILIGASGCGKTWLSCAFGVNACINKYRAKYIRLPELFSEFEVHRIQGTYRTYLKNLQKYDLLILDEFLLSPTNESERADLLELMESRCNKKSTIFCSRWTPEGWHQRLGDGPIADAILDRIINSSYTIVLHGKSMREEYSKIK